MRLSCPNCLTEYDVPDAALAARSRSIRCARCGHQWQNTVPEAAPLPLQPPLETPVWQPEPATGSMPEPLPPLDPLGQIPERSFGQAVDEDARAEIEAAAMTEGGPPLKLASQEANTEAGQALPDEFATRADSSPDGFAELFRSSRDRAANPEAEPAPPKPPLRISSKPLLIGLVILFVLGLVILEHRAVMHAIPATAPLFHAWGLK